MYQKNNCFWIRIHINVLPIPPPIWFRWIQIETHSKKHYPFKLKLNVDPNSCKQTIEALNQVKN
ncbi:hypothetical protein HanRHA438_Chr09g0402811 [Helianthus annuus]|nr:hypothetical protein HanRHA438_Chr09g0402811 [Helianthus annuus]